MDVGAVNKDMNFSVTCIQVSKSYLSLYDSSTPHRSFYMKSKCEKCYVWQGYATEQTYTNIISIFPWNKYTKWHRQQCKICYM